MKKLREPLIKPRNRKNLAPVHAYYCEILDAVEDAVDYWVDNSDCYLGVAASGVLGALTGSALGLAAGMYIGYRTFC